MALEIIPIKVTAPIAAGVKLGEIAMQAVKQNSHHFEPGDILVIAQKVVSKAEGRVVRLSSIKPTPRARRLARKHGKEPELMELILRESRQLLVAKNGIIITETLHGFVCANSGIDQSNIQGHSAVLLPENPDASARALRAYVKEAAGVSVAVIITDTFGRAFRMGQTNVAIGVAGLEPIKSYIGSKDMFGRKLKVTEIAVADEIASASELVMGKAEGIPIAIVRGYRYAAKERASGHSLLRPENEDLFR